MSELAEAHIADVFRYEQTRGHAQLYTHDVWPTESTWMYAELDFFIGPNVHETDEKTTGALKTHFNIKNDLRQMLK